ncbi:MAG TPA: hypothetical protein V6C88_04905 [Chroococcidiopsis sp.]
MANLNKDNFQQTINTRKATPDEVAYRNGYAQGRHSNRKVTYTTPIVRDSNDTANGVLLGILLASLIGLITAAFFIVTKQDQPRVVETPLPQALPQSTQPNGVQPQPVQRETTVIERTTDRLQEVAPAAPPDVRVTVPVTPPSATANPNPSPAAPGQATTPEANSQPPQDTQTQTTTPPAPGASNPTSAGQK